MINTMEVDAKRQVKSAVPGTKFILAEDVPIEAEIIPYFPQNYNLTINELGKQLLKASTDGNLEDIRMLMGKGAPFTADWLGTSPLHLAAQNNHLEVCEVLLRAGMLKDARTKVDRTPLHMAAYEGHLDIVECLLKNGADYDAKDLLHMTPLHWAAQNGHAEVATLLIRYGATTNIANKFDLTPVDIAMQINRPDIVQIINLGIRDPISATEHLALELISENSTGSTVDDPVMAITENTTEVEEGEEPPSIPFEAIMVEEEGTENSEETTQQFEEHIQELPAHIETVEEEDGNFSESIKYLQQHGITMLPVDESTILNSVMESGHSVVLTEAGKQALNSIKSEANQEIKEYLIPKTKLTTIKKKKIITVTPEEYLAMTSGGQLTTQPNILKQINGKIINTIQKPQQIKRIVMKKNKVIPISPHITKIQKVEKINDVEFLMEQLRNAQTLIESYKKKLFHSEVETARYKRKLKLLMEQNKISSSI